MSRKIKILFIRPSKSSFIQKDLELLERHFDVRTVDFPYILEKPKDALKTVFGMIKDVLWANLTFSWFAGLHALVAVLLSKIFRKKSIVIVGGYEVAKVPEIEYGAMLNPRSARIVKYVLKNADKVLAVSEFNKKETLNYIDSKNVELVYNGVDCDIFKPQGEKNKDLVITVGGVTNNTRKTKGLEVFVNTAKYLPDIEFILIGLAYDKAIEHLKAIAPANVEFRGYIPHQELPKWYQKAKVYCQLSYRESFGVSLAEAMACECIPVVTDNAALPEVVGDTGFYVPYGDEKATADAIKKALKSNKGKDARERIKNMFTIKRREKKLIKIIERVLE